MLNSRQIIYLDKNWEWAEYQKSGNVNIRKHKPRGLLELLENKSKIKQDLINKEHNFIF